MASKGLHQERTHSAVPHQLPRGEVKEAGPPRSSSQGLGQAASPPRKSMREQFPSPSPGLFPGILAPPATLTPAQISKDNHKRKAKESREVGGADERGDQ